MLHNLSAAFLQPPCPARRAAPAAPKAEASPAHPRDTRSTEGPLKSEATPAILPIGRTPNLGSHSTQVDVHHIAQRIRTRLAESGLTARAAGLKIGRSADTIRNLLRAADAGQPYSPRIDTLDAIAAALDCDPVWLRYGVKQSSDGLKSQPVALSADATLLRLGDELETAWAAERAANAAWNAASPADRRKTLDDAVDEAWAKTYALVDRIVAIRATTLDGLRVKMRATLWCGTDEVPSEEFFSEGATMDERLAGSMLMDLFAIDRRPVPTAPSAPSEPAQERFYGEVVKPRSAA